MSDDDPDIDVPDIDAEAPPRRFKRIEELTVNEHLERRRTGQAPETDEYRAYRRAVLRRYRLSEAGVNESAAAMEQMTPADHARRKYGD